MEHTWQMALILGGSTGLACLIVVVYYLHKAKRQRNRRG